MMEDEYTFKADKNKLLAALPMEDFPLALLKIIEVGSYGAQKYSRHSWNLVKDNKQRYTDAMFRHLLAHFSGEKLDQESGVSHLSHAAWGMLAILQLEEISGRNNENRHS